MIEKEMTKIQLKGELKEAREKITKYEYELNRLENHLDNMVEERTDALR